jgi:DNA-binding NarL/FixJ family response regulator
MPPSTSTASGLRLILADDHVVVRQGIRALLEGARLEVVGEASDGQTAVQLCETLHPDVAILDVAMPRMNGVDAAREIRRSSPQTRVVVLTVFPEESYVLEALQAGVSGYVLKSNAASNLLDAIVAASRGEIYLSPTISRAVVNAYLSSGEVPRDPLSVRERQVLQLIAEGRSMREVGELLGISARTAETHRARIMEKLNIHDVPGLVRYAIRHGLISLSA